MPYKLMPFIDISQSCCYIISDFRWSVENLNMRGIDFKRLSIFCWLVWAASSTSLLCQNIFHAKSSHVYIIILITRLHRSIQRKRPFQICLGVPPFCGTKTLSMDKWFQNSTSAQMKESWWVAIHVFHTTGTFPDMQLFQSAHILSWRIDRVQWFRI